MSNFIQNNITNERKNKIHKARYGLVMNQPTFIIYDANMLELLDTKL